MRRLFLITLMIFLAVSSHADLNINPGLWKITTQTERSQLPKPGLPMSMPSTTHNQCIGAEGIIPRAPRNASGQCTIVSQRIKNDTMQWEMSCDSPQGIISTLGTITYQGDSLTGTKTVTGAGRPQKMTTKMTGKRLGPCQ